MSRPAERTFQIYRFVLVLSGLTLLLYLAAWCVSGDDPGIWRMLLPATLVAASVRALKPAGLRRILRGLSN